MDPAFEYHRLQSRRQFFEGAGLKVGGIALAPVSYTHLTLPTSDLV